MTVSTQNLYFNYDKDPILEDISFEIQKGAFVGIFGPNGGGKTTLLNLLLGFLSPKKGKIELLGKKPNQIQTKLGYVPQVKRFDKSFPLSVLDVVMQGCLSEYQFFKGYPQSAKKSAQEALELVHLTEKADAHFGTLSGGQIQRMLIARALASKPEILLLDEATVGVDINTLKDIFQALLKMRGKITILMVTHDLQQIASEMDQLLCINRSVTHYKPQEVCGHFAMGLYHPRLQGEKNA